MIFGKNKVEYFIHPSRVSGAGEMVGAQNEHQVKWQTGNLVSRERAEIGGRNTDGYGKNDGKAKAEKQEWRTKNRLNHFSDTRLEQKEEKKR